MCGTVTLFLFYKLISRYSISSRLQFLFLDIIGQDGNRHREVLFYLHFSVIRLRLRFEPAAVVFCGTGEAKVLQRNIRSLVGRRQ